MLDLQLIGQWAIRMKLRMSEGRFMKQIMTSVAANGIDLTDHLRVAHHRQKSRDFGAELD
jgi:hypothetical protein